MQTLDLNIHRLFFADFLEIEVMNSDLYYFLAEAKKQTYANVSAQKISSTRAGSFDYSYSNGKMIYHDTYFGGTKFMGEEVVYYSDNTPIWGMNYYGVTLNENLSEEVIDNALRPALMKVGEDNNLPVRGPKKHTNNGYKYTFEVNGDIDYFEGVETIFKGNEKIYVLKCHGGIIKR
ncbi:MAG: hypothetical protein HFE30_04725 [Clostridiales bacterium]|nr:hypothetical protein [Clostridiales bacterium]